MGLQAAFDSLTATATADPGDTLLDYACVNDLRLYSVQLILTGQVKGDSFKVEIFDKDGIWGTPNTSIQTLINKWAVNSVAPVQTLPALAENQLISAGLYLRITYTSIGTVPVDITANLQLYNYVS